MAISTSHMPSYILFRHGLDNTILLYMSQSTHSFSSPLHKHWKIISLKSYTSTQKEVDTLMHRFTSTRNEMYLYLITCSTPILNRGKQLLENKLLSTWNRGNAHKLSQCLFLVELESCLPMWSLMQELLPVMLLPQTGQGTHSREEFLRPDFFSSPCPPASEPLSASVASTDPSSNPSCTIIRYKSKNC